MSATPTYQMVDKLLATPVTSYIANGLVLSLGEVDKLRTELRALLTERDALKPAPVERRLREIRIGKSSVQYDPKRELFVLHTANERNHTTWETPAGLACYITVHGDDKTVDALRELRASPHEPVETVEDVLAKHVTGVRLIDGQSRSFSVRLAELAAELRAAVRAEAPNAGAGR